MTIVEKSSEGGPSRHDPGSVDQGSSPGVRELGKEIPAAKTIKTIAWRFSVRLRKSKETTEDERIMVRIGRRQDLDYGLLCGVLR